MNGDFALASLPGFRGWLVRRPHRGVLCAQQHDGVAACSLARYRCIGILLERGLFQRSLPTAPSSVRYRQYMTVCTKTARTERAIPKTKHRHQIVSFRCERNDWCTSVKSTLYFPYEYARIRKPASYPASIARLIGGKRHASSHRHQICAA